MVSRTTAVVLLICIPLPRATATAFPAVMMIMIVTIYNLQLLAASAARVNRASTFLSLLKGVVI